jgi:EAL domain-containing protein (putative c-di-GMP-specific phosphodiesterase class I)
MRIEEDDQDRQLVRNIVRLALIFKTKICVEGIETAGMRDTLRDFHVDCFQGYFYAKPMPPEQLTEWKMNP